MQRIENKELKAEATSETKKFVQVGFTQKQGEFLTQKFLQVSRSNASKIRAADDILEKDLSEIKFNVRCLGHDVHFMQKDINLLRAEMNEKNGGLRAEMNEKIGGLRAEMNARFDSLKSEISTIKWMIPLFLGLYSALPTLFKLLT